MCKLEINGKSIREKTKRDRSIQNGTTSLEIYIPLKNTIEVINDQMNHLYFPFFSEVDPEFVELKVYLIGMAF